MQKNNVISFCSLPGKPSHTKCKECWCVCVQQQDGFQSCCSSARHPLTSTLKNIRSLESSSPMLSGMGFSPPASRNRACRAAGTLKRRWHSSFSFPTSIEPDIKKMCGSHSVWQGSYQFTQGVHCAITHVLQFANAVTCYTFTIDVILTVQPRT